MRGGQVTGRDWMSALTMGALIVAGICGGCSDKGHLFPYRYTIDTAVVVQTDVSEKFGREAIEKFREVYAAYETLVPFSSKRTRPVTISIFKDRDAFLRYQKSVSPTRSDTGFYVSDRGELALRYRGTRATLATLYHEAFHAYFEDRFIHPPVWLNEGLAQYVETIQFGITGKAKFGKIHYAWIRRLHEVMKNDSLPSIADIVINDWPERHMLSDEQYAISWALVYFLLEKDEKAFYAYLGLLYDRQSPAAAFEKVWPSYTDLDAEWRAVMRRTITKERIIKLLPGV